MLKSEADEGSDKDVGASETAKFQKKPMSMKAAIDSYKLDHKRETAATKKQSVTGKRTHHGYPRNTTLTLTEMVIQLTPRRQRVPMRKCFLLTVISTCFYSPNPHSFS